MQFDGEFAQLVVRFPVDMLPRRTLRDATSTPLAGPARLVTDFLLGLEKLDPAAASELVPHALGLLDTALGWAARRAVGEQSQLAITRERVHRFVREHASDTELGAAAVAAGCRISRRTLFRALADDEPLTALLRRIRVERAQQLLRSNPRLPIAAVAGQCGFAGAAQLHRAFQRVTGGTPGDHRRRSATFDTN
jgi:transcriptional regulator GlxA family with amidase domain